MTAHSPRIPRPLTAIIFDIDGTLYRQTPLRRAMLLRLVAAHAGRPVEGWRTLRALQAYRRAQEVLRADSGGNLAAEQLRVACDRCGLAPRLVADRVERWMEREPLALLHRFRYPGLVPFLDACRERRLKLATLSDYPGDDKLQSLGVAGYFDVRLCAQSPDIGVFKPDPKGIEVTLERLGVSASQTLYVGDRHDVDAQAARAAGVMCAIVSQRPSVGNDDVIRASSYEDLHRAVFGSDCGPRRSA